MDEHPAPDEAAAAADGSVGRTIPSIFPIVGIGASAGGLKAFGQLFGALPAGLGMAVVVIQHLDPRQESVLPHLLARQARIPVFPAADGVAVAPGHAYVITPNTSLAIVHGILRVSPRPPGPQPHLAIDTFLRSLAADRPGSAIGVILSGAGSDGTSGLAAIKAAGGATFAQDDSAECPDMPHSAIGGGHVDAVLPPEGIAQELGRIARSGLPTMESRLPPGRAGLAGAGTMGEQPRSPGHPDPLLEELRSAEAEVRSAHAELAAINDELRAAHAELATISATLRSSGELNAAVLETVPRPLVVLRPDGRVEGANQAFLTAFGLVRTQTLGRTLAELDGGVWDSPELRGLLEAAPPAAPLAEVVEIRPPPGRPGGRTLRLDIHRTPAGDERSRLIVLGIFDPAAGRPA